MSCFLPHKEAVNNLKADLEKSGYKTIPLGTRINIQAFQEHNRLVVEEAKKIQEVVNQWNAGLSKIGITGSVVKTITKPFEGDRDSFVGINRNLINIEFNNDVLNQLDNARKNLGIYDSKLSYSSYLKEQQELIKDLDVIKPGVEELFNSNPELASKVYEALGFNDNNFELKENKEAFGKEPHPEGATTYDIFSNDRKIGKIALFDGKNPMIKGLNLNESERNKGLGKALYKWLNYKATLKGGRLYADQEFISLDAQRVWESLNKEGLVDLTGNSPKFNDKQKQQAQQLYSQYLDTIFPDSKVKDIKGFKNFVAKPGVAPFSEKTEGGVKLKDGNSYTSKQLSAKMLLAMGYTIDEAGKIIKDNKC